MNKSLRTLVALLATVLFFSVSIAVPAAEADSNAARPLTSSELFGDSVVAKGKGFEIKRSQLDEEVFRLKGQVAARGRTMSPEESLALEKQVLDQLIQLALLRGKATDAEKAAAKESADKRIEEAQTALGSDEIFKRRLKAEGLTREQLLNKWSEGAAAESAAKREMNVVVTDDDAKKYYESKPGNFETPEMVRVSHILFSTQDPNDTNPDPNRKRELSDAEKKAKRKQAEDVLKQARDGQDFTKLARQYSEDPAVKQNNGEYKFSRDDPFVPEFKAAAFSLNTNQISDIVTTMFGYHIIKLWEKIPARTEPYSGPDTKATMRRPDGQYVTASIKEILTNEALSKQFPDYIKQLRKDADVQILDEKLKPDLTADTTVVEPGIDQLVPKSAAK